MPERGLRIYAAINLTAMVLHGCGELVGWAGGPERWAWALMAISTSVFVAADLVVLARRSRGEES